MQKNTLRLHLFSDCNRDCVGCCNNDWDIKKLPVVSGFCDYTEILLTGGEPLIRPDVVVNTVGKIRKETNAPIYIYTAKTDDLKTFFDILDMVDGVCLTLHDQKDAVRFIGLHGVVLGSTQRLRGKSLRLNIFKGVKTHIDPSSTWVVKENIEWIKDCPLPQGETFARLDNANHQNK